MSKLKCKYCGSDKIRKNGNRYNQNGKHQRYVCSKCGRGIDVLTNQIEQFRNEHGDAATKEEYGIDDVGIQTIQKEFAHLKNMPQILLLDIETAPIKCLTFETFKTNINHEQILTDYYILCWSAKWLFSPDMITDCVTPDESVHQNDKRIMKRLWPLIEKANVVIGHNVKKFDIPKINTRMKLNGLNPPAPYQMIDTLESVKKNFSFTKNRLDYLGQLIENKRKLKTDFDLWARCYAGDDEALTYMSVYNEQDVKLLEDVYLHLRPWFKIMPNIGLIGESDVPVCACCGSKNLSPAGYYYTTVSRFEAFRCNDCGYVSHGRKTQVSLHDRQVLLSTSAK